MYTSYHIGFVVCSSTPAKLCSASKRGHWFWGKLIFTLASRHAAAGSPILDFARVSK